MAEQRTDRELGWDGGERSEPESHPNSRAAEGEGAEALPRSGTPGGSYTAGEKAAALRSFSSSGSGMRDWCARRGISTATLCAWRRAYSKGGLDALDGRSRARPKPARAHRQYSPEERREAVAAFGKSGLKRAAFARLWGISETTLSRWLTAYRKHGPRGLEAPWGGGRRGRKKVPIPEVVRAEIVAVKRSQPRFGLRRIRDELARVLGVRVGLHRVREVVAAEGLKQPVVKPKVRRAPPQVRRFERSRPGEMWQSDITSYVLARHSQRVYLTVFLDDHSRYVVSWALALQQRSDLVCESLLEGIARFGKPKEVLTDQGRQYFAWRGKSRFQKLLIREGIAHVVSRAHHPQTLGKCERLWQTVGQELWERSRPQDLDEARRRMGHFFDHYNHFRPHQGIGSLVPAERFFGAEVAARTALEKRMDDNALRLALGQEPRRPVYLYGQIGDDAVSLHGERGRLVIQHPGGRRSEIALDTLGVAGDDDDRSEQSPREEPADAARDAARDADEDPAEASSPGSLCAAQAPSCAGTGALGGGQSGRPEGGPRTGDDPARVLVGDQVQERGGRGTGCDATARVADEPDGAERPGVRAAAAATLEEGAEGAPDRPAERSRSVAPGTRPDSSRVGGGQATDRAAALASGELRPQAPSSRQAAHKEASGGRHVATRQGLRPPQGRPEEVGPTPHREPPDPDSIPWWESSWGEVFEAWERLKEPE